MMTELPLDAAGQIMLTQFDPDFRPRFRIRARRWWQIWKPRWEWIDGVSRNDLLRAHGLPELPSTHVRFVEMG